MVRSDAGPHGVGNGRALIFDYECMTVTGLSDTYIKLLTFGPRKLQVGMKHEARCESE